MDMMMMGTCVSVHVRVCARVHVNPFFWSDTCMLKIQRFNRKTHGFVCMCIFCIIMLEHLSIYIHINFFG